MRLLIALWIATLPAATLQAQIVSQGSGRSRGIALTFDAGADRGYAGRILKTLERNHIHATFGMTGRWAQMNPDLVRRMARDHDQLINHTYDHRSFTGYSTQTGPLSPQGRAWELWATERMVWHLTHRSTKPFFRPPYGDYDPATLRQVRALGYRYMVMWTVDCLGWMRVPVPTILNQCITRARPGAILVMHVGSQSLEAFALPALISALRHRHYRFVTVAQLIGYSPRSRSR